MDKWIEKARYFVEKCLTNQIGNIDEEYYYMFLISKFLLLKEYIIKKDAKTNTLYFDYVKNKEYIFSIKYIVDYILQKGTIVKNSTNIIIKNVENTDNLELYIWIFNKLRDSFAHGMYKIDTQKGQIIIDNDHAKEKDPFVLKCILPIDLLEEFSFLAYTHQDNFTRENKEEFFEYKKNLREKFNYNLYDINKFNKEDIAYFKNESANIKNSKYITNLYDENESNKKIYNYVQILEFFIYLLKESKNLSPKDKKEILTYLKSLNFNKTKPENDGGKDYEIRITKVIDEMAMILGMNKKSKNSMILPALYNYMQLTFSFVSKSFKKLSAEEKRNLGFLKISKINPLYIKYSAAEFKQNLEAEYFLKIKSIEKYCLEFTYGMSKKIESYNEHKSANFRASLMDYFVYFYESIITSFGDKNALILTSVRNAIEHANINEYNGNILLCDQHNQDDNKTVNFLAYGKAEDLFEITKNIEMNKSANEFTIEAFLTELKSVIDKDIFNSVYQVLQQMSFIIFGKNLEQKYTLEQMYMEAFVNILNSQIKR